MANVAEIITKIRAYAEQSEACQEMAADTADNAEAAAEYRSEGEAIQAGYDDAIEAIESGRLDDAAEILESVRVVEARGGDDGHARRSLAALGTLVEVAS